MHCSNIHTAVAAATLAIAPLAVACAPQGKPAPVDQDTGDYFNVLPPGQHGTANALEAAQLLAQGTRPAHWDDQMGMYSGLLYAAPGLAPQDITKYFKRASLEAKMITRTETPRAGVSIVRDEFDVPHVRGETAADVYFGAGYVTAEDRLFAADVLRHLGRGRISELLGATEENLALDRGIVLVAGYSEDELTQQADELPVKLGALGQEVLDAAHAYVAGMNARILESVVDPTKLPAEYPALQVLPLPWNVSDVVAVATLIQATLAVGGGQELANAHLRGALGDRHPKAKATAIYRDLLQREDPDAPTTTGIAFPYLAPAPVNPAAMALPDPGSFEGHDPVHTLRDLFADAGIVLPGAMSNFLAVTADVAAGGHPIAVMGPQTGYFSPNLLLELSLEGGGLSARGAAFAGAGLFVLLGRGVDYAWSATSGESDQVDVRVERLCEPDGSPPMKASTHYLYQGVCTAMYRRVDTFLAKPTAGALGEDGLPPEPALVTHTIERTVHGPVIGRATVDGAPVAVSLQRSTFFGELDSTPAFMLLNRGYAQDPQTFFDAVARVTGTFNWLFVDDENVAYFHSGLYPRRAPGVDPELPVWGTGEWEWQGFLAQHEHPHEIDPPKGFITSWNNKPAPAWRAADGNYSYGPVYRSLSLDDRLAPAALTGGVTVTRMIDIMQDAATVDLRGSQVLPLALSVLEGDVEVAPYTAVLSAWVAAGAHRRAPAPDLPYDHQAAIALMDAWWERLVRAVFDDELAGVYDLIPLPIDDPNRREHVGSAFQEGFYGLVAKALRQALGLPVGSPMSVLSCGGSRHACRSALRDSLLSAVAALEARFGGGPSTWAVSKGDDEIQFQALGLVTLPSMDWQNRPTFQQVVQVLHRRADP